LKYKGTWRFLGGRMDSGIDGLFGAGKGSINKIFKDSRKWLLVPAPGFKDEGTEHISHGQMDTFNDGVGLRILRCSRYILNSIVTKDILKFLSNKFWTTIIMDAGCRSWVTAKPNVMKNSGYMGTCLVAEFGQL
jgi:hypothetical protein